MAKEIPDSMDELVYFSRRKFTAQNGKAIAWVKRAQCPKCKKGLMSKPWDKEKKKFKVRAKEYVCPECGFEEEKSEHEKRLCADVIYACPFCSKDGETQAPFTRKSFYGKKAIVFNCESCGEKLGITKKLAVPDKFLKKIAGADIQDSDDSASADDDDDF